MVNVYDDKDYKNPFRPDGTLRKEVDALLKQSVITRSQCIIPNTISKKSNNHELPRKTCIQKFTNRSKERTVRFSPNASEDFDELGALNSVDVNKMSLINGNNIANNQFLIKSDDKKVAIVQQPVNIEKFANEENKIVVENVNIEVEKCCKIV